MKYAILIFILAVSLIAFWVEIPADSARALSAPDSIGHFPIDSTVALSADTTAAGLIRTTLTISFSEGLPLLLRQIGYCVPADSTRRFFALCPELERWFQWQE